MNVKEAIARIEEHNSIHSVKEYPFAIKITEALNMAVEALEKQIPKKVVRYSDDESDHAYCPCCNECIGSNDMIYEDFYCRGFAPMYCQECGQAMILR